MRKHLMAIAAFAVASFTSISPALAADNSDAGNTFTCAASASLTRNAKLVFSSTGTFQSTQDVSGNYSRTSTYAGATYTFSASVSCKR